MTHKHNGFTLVELMVTVAIAVLLLLIGVPALSSVYQQSRSETNIKTIQEALTFARAQAVSYGREIIVCPYAASPCGTDWSKGLSVYTLNAGAKRVLREYQGFNSQDAIKVTGADAEAKISFGADGMVSSNAEFIYCPNGASSASRSAKLDASGRLSEGSNGLSCG
ncbi:GspH/FimT family pseudopilin [Shewanella sp. AS16]|uniref:GspH/FimT family pseudopilin n=1 Tax=Shewanella sp. AS16 TaxID=2907625 RepID=UPI001F29C0DC|nr:GspH/FimT family pseudopilin [Shewanella sp. AS16]MCE9685274.1 GspH/FimT family pseudopilin [Shewanella sp. AS16]